MSNGIKHTPGPLQAHVDCPNWYGFEAKFFEVTTEDSGIVAFIKDGMCRDTAVANTRLFAAAPELFSALEDLVNMLDVLDRPKGPLYKSAVEALNKARGQCPATSTAPSGGHSGQL
jgi:hypothetical protein